MTTRRTLSIAAPRANPVYHWKLLEGGILQIAGPLSRPPQRRRKVSLKLLEVPASLQSAVRADQHSNVQEPFVAGHRIAQVLHVAMDEGFILDLSRATREAQRLRTYVQWLKEGVDSLPEAFVLYDDQDRLLIANTQYAQLYPTTAELLQPGISFRDFATAALTRGQVRLEESADDWLRRRIEFHDKGEGYFDQHLSDGRWLQLSERRTPSGGVAGILADITPLKVREEALRRAMLDAESTSRSMTRFLATFSHEVRNGLNGVAGLAQLLAFDAESASQRSRAELMLQSSKRLTTVLTDLLDYLKNEAMGVVVRLAPVSPRALLHTLRAELEPQAAQRKIGLRWELSQDVPPWIEADGGRILQVLANLSGNALKHVEGGAVTIKLALAAKKIRFEVEDEGLGIAAEDIEGLFEYFVQAGPHRASSSGLGLAICKQLVLAMGGQIGVDSSLGQGSRFWFELPLRLATPPDRQLATTDLTNPITTLRVGIVDDDPLNATVAQALLLRLGHQAVVFESSLDIAERIREEPLDLLLLDLMMPGESGFDVAKRLRADSHPACSSLILVALTGNVVPNSLASCADAGINAILQKPLFLDQLEHVLDWAAKRQRIAPAGPPEVFTGSKVAETVGPAPVSAYASLSQLADDIGDIRFIQSVRAAKKLFKQAAQAATAEREALLRIAHRVAGTAPQLGFRYLGACARTIDTHLTSGEREPNESILNEWVQRMRQAAYDATAVLDEQLTNRQKKSARSRR
jgi:signal transduction histidine kinase/CheY-like chemotaxis protein